MFVVVFIFFCLVGQCVVLCFIVFYDFGASPKNQSKVDLYKKVLIIQYPIFMP